MILEILKYPNPKLALKSVNVTDFNADLARLLDNMAETMYSANGVGLAAPQVGVSQRLFVIDVATEGQNRELLEFVNPEISGGEGTISFEEGCLSVPGVSEEVVRKEKITVKFQDRNGNPKSLTAEGLLAVAIQHENDHLDGVLFIERLSLLKKRFVKRKLAKVNVL